MVADTSQFARFIREQWPQVRNLEDVIPEIAQPSSPSKSGEQTAADISDE